jgi:hypothetical protein
MGHATFAPYPFELIYNYNRILSHLTYALQKVSVDEINETKITSRVLPSTLIRTIYLKRTRRDILSYHLSVN